MHHRFHVHLGSADWRRGHGHFARGFREGGRRMGQGRARAADLQLLVLALLSDKPRYGYEIIQAMAESSRGLYKPSPSIIYPALTYLEEIGQATSTDEGGRKRFKITDSGQSHLEANRTTADDAPRGRRGAHRSTELWLAGRDLKSALREKRVESAEEQQRIVGILQRATAEILGKTGD